MDFCVTSAVIHIRRCGGRASQDSWNLTRRREAKRSGVWESCMTERSLASHAGVRCTEKACTVGSCWLDGISWPQRAVVLKRVGMPMVYAFFSAASVCSVFYFVN